MRATAVLCRVYIPQEFVYTKRFKQGTAHHESIVSAVHVFQKTPPSMPGLSVDGGQSSKIVVVPLFDYAFPVFWETVKHTLVDEHAESVLIEGNATEYIRKRYRGKGVGRGPMFYERWRRQRMPSPWDLPHPLLQHGGDTVTWSKLQTLFPFLRPKVSAEEARKKAGPILARAEHICERYHTNSAALLFHHRYAPGLAEALEEKGYKLVHKLEVDAANTMNERYDGTMAYLKHEMELLVNST